MYYLEYNYELNSELEEECLYEYYVLHYNNKEAYEEDNVLYEGSYVNLKVWKL